jgi:hypothetical protein
MYARCETLLCLNVTTRSLCFMLDSDRTASSLPLPSLLLGLRSKCGRAVSPIGFVFLRQRLRFLDYFKPFHGWIPYLQQPPLRLSFAVQAIWTLCALFALLILQQTPIYGLRRGAAFTEDVDFLVWLKPMFLCSHGTVIP